MKRFMLLPFVVIVAALSAFGQDKQLSQCQQRMDDPDLFPLETCSVILTYLSPMDEVGPISQDGSFIVDSPNGDGTVNLTTYTLPPKLRSEVAMKSLKSTLDDVEFMAEKKPDSIFPQMLAQGRDYWVKLRDVYCYYHPQGRYTDLFSKGQTCNEVMHIPDEKTVENELSGVLVFKVNFDTFRDTDNCNGEQKCLQRLVDINKPLIDALKKGSKGANASQAPHN